MHSSLLLGLWACVSFVLYKIIAVVLASRHHAQNARKLGCEPAHSPNGWDLIGIRATWWLLQADKKADLPAHFKFRFEDASAKQNRPVTTFYQNQLGNDTFHTIEPKNIQALLATQFKDFGLGKTRNANFHPLLGNGIVSALTGARLE
jgi:hypothetical protein